MIPTAPAASAPSPQPGGSKPEFIHVATAPGLFMLNSATGAYEARGSGVIGIVVVGSGVSYTVMVYDAAKVTYATVPINANVRSRRAEVCHKHAVGTTSTPPPPLPLHRLTQHTFALQPGTAGQYVTFAAPAATGGAGGGAGEESWSIAFAAATAASDFLRTLALVVAHQTVHGTGGGLQAAGLTEVATVVESRGDGAGGEGAVVAGGDTVALGYTVYAMNTLPSAKPTDMPKQPVVASNMAAATASLEEAHDVTAVVAANAGFSRLVVGRRQGDRVMQLVPLQELIAVGDIVPDRAAAALAAAGRSSYAVAEMAILAVRKPAAPAPAPAPVPAPTEPAPAPAPAATPLLAASSSGDGALEDAVDAALDATANGTAAATGGGGYVQPDGERERSESVNLKERMARLAMAGRSSQQPMMPPFSAGEWGVETGGAGGGGQGITGSRCVRL
jgi:hypothetical protein